jgi:hypothetical protein
MKQITLTLALAAITAAPLPAFAGRDQAQTTVLERAYARQAQRQAQSQPSTQRDAANAPAAAGPAGQTAKEGAPADRQLELLKRFHPKHAYGG